jgi:hypothetical protein
MQMKFESRLGRSKITRTLVMVLPFLAILFHMAFIGFSPETILFFMGILLLSLVLVVWQLIDTSYWIDDVYFYYRSGGRRGKIDIRSIFSLEKCQKWIPLGDASRSLQGVLIHFRHGQLFIGPQDEEILIRELQKINPSLRIFSS